MEQQDRQNGLRQKVRLGQVEGQARAVSLARALRLTLAKVGEELFDLPLAACRLPLAACRAWRDLQIASQQRTSHCH